jgi:ribosomal protein S26
MFAKLADVLFGCWHSRYSFPITVTRTSRNRVKAAQPTGTYVVCLDCAKELPYDWKQMRVVSENYGRASAVGALTTKEAA